MTEGSFRREGRGTAVAVAAFFVLVTTAEAFAGPIADFFSWRTPVPPGLYAAIDAYEDGRFFAAAASAGEVLGSGTESARDEAELVRALSFEALGWKDLAARSFVAVLEAEPVSPYYPLALLGLLEALHADGRPVADAYQRWFESPWRGTDARSVRIRHFLSSYGELRKPRSPRTREERDLLSRPSDLVDALRNHGERPAERLLYLAGLDLFRAKRYRESLGALARIALTSPYHRYALYTSAQARFALGEMPEALEAVRTLLSLPATDGEEIGLAERAGLLQAQLLLEAGFAEDALRAAGRLSGDGAYAMQARLLRAEISLEREEPGLAIAYYRDAPDTLGEPRFAAGRGLGLGAAYAALGDLRSAAEAFRLAAADLDRVRGELTAAARVDRLRSLAVKSVRRRRASDAERRGRLGAGIRRVLELEGPLNFGKIVRVVFAPHRDTIVGQAVVDVRLLAEANEPVDAVPVAHDRLWREYLGSPERRPVEEALAWLVDHEDDGGAEAALAVLDARLKWLEGRFGEVRAEHEDVPEAAADLFARLFPEGEFLVSARGIASPAGIAAARSRMAASAVAAAPGGEEPSRMLRETRSLLESAVDEELERFLRSQNEDLRRLQYDLEAALSEVLALQAASPDH